MAVGKTGQWLLWMDSLVHKPTPAVRGHAGCVCVWTVMKGSDAHKIACVDLELDILQL